jgi:NADH dehydrogenase
VEVILNTRVLAMTSSRVMLGEGREIESHTVVSTVGNAPNPMLTELCQRHQIPCEKGRIICEPTLRVAGHERLWSAGDCAAVPMKVPAGNGEKAATAAPAAESAPFVPQKYCPPTAQFAQRQGELMGKNIACALKNSTSLEPFTFTGLGELASIGHKAAVAEILGLKFQGFFAWWLWRTIYLMKLPGLERKLRVIVDWTLDLFFPRDIALFQPKPTQLIKEMHLEKGDVVFHAGDPAWSLYIVRSGALELRLADGTVERAVK